MLNEADFELKGNISENDLYNESEKVVPEIITDLDKLESMSLSIQKKNKDALADLKKRVMFSLDKRKLKEAEKIISGMENIGEIFSDAKIMSSVRTNIKNASDLKFLAEAYSKLLDSQQKLMRLDSVDGQGTARRLNIGVQYEDESGTKLNTVISVKEVGD